MSYPQDQVREFTYHYGIINQGQAWILSPFDTWEANPFYNGPEVPHPESDKFAYLTNEERLEREEDWATDVDIPY